MDCARSSHYQAFIKRFDGAIPEIGVRRLAWVEQDGNRIFFQLLQGGGESSVATTNSSETPVILHHGLAQWGDDWASAGWLSAFGDRPVCVIDALGHGRSDRPSERSAYSVEKRAEAVLLVAGDAGFDSFAFFGFSMGGRVGFELALEHESRVERLIVGGMHGLRPSIDRDNLERRVAVLRSNKWRLVERAVGAKKDDGRNNEAEALAVSTEAVLDWRGADDRLENLAVPTLIYCGAQDSLLEYARNTADLIPFCQFEELVSTGHAASFYSSEQAKISVQRFLTPDA